ncbi:MAG: hypothetical protein GX879_01530, partial [Bacteroidales bacterium]|nr:hypothetical protein [Bacteroidales bacterium]
MIASVSWWWLLLFFVLSGAMAALLYYREKSLRDWKPWQKTVMAFIRFVFVFIIFLLLFAPLIKHSKSILEKPIIIIAQDNSASVLMNSDSVYYSGQYIQNLNNVEKRLSENFEVHRYNFGEFFRQDSIINYTDDATNMAEIFPEISAAYAGM